jgi:integrase
VAEVSEETLVWPFSSQRSTPSLTAGDAVHRPSAEEVLALEWEDIDFENLSMRVVRAVVHGRVKMVETEYSEDELPLDPEFATVLLDRKLESEREAAAEDSPHRWG